jgi:hypothetical protein
MGDLVQGLREVVGCCGGGDVAGLAVPGLLLEHVPRLPPGPAGRARVKQLQDRLAAVVKCLHAALHGLTPPPPILPPFPAPSPFLGRAAPPDFARQRAARKSEPGGHGARGGESAAAAWEQAAGTARERCAEAVCLPHGKRKRVIPRLVAGCSVSGREF